MDILSQSGSADTSQVKKKKGVVGNRCGTISMHRRQSKKKKGYNKTLLAEKIFDAVYLSTIKQFNWTGGGFE